MSSPNLPLAVETMSASPVETLSASPVETLSASPVETMSSGSCTRVFWDLVDYPFPTGLDPDLIYLKMKSFLESMGFLGEVSIMAYVDKENLRDEWLDDAYKKARINIFVVPPLGDDYARVRFMVLNIAVWKMENPATYLKPLNLMVISKQIEKQSVLLTYIDRMLYVFYRVLLTLDLKPSSSSVHTVIFDSIWKPIDQSGTLQGSDHKRKSREETVPSTNSLRQKVDQSS